MNSQRDGRGYRVVPFPMAQRQGIDWLALMHRQHTVHALLELDITDARQAIREHRARAGEALSLTAFIVACLATAVSEYPTCRHTGRVAGAWFCSPTST